MRRVDPVGGGLSRPPQWLSHLWTASYDLTSEQRRCTARVVGLLSFLLIAAVLLAAVAVATGTVPVDHPIWEAVLNAHLVLVRLALAVPLVILGAVAGTAIFQPL